MLKLNLKHFIIASPFIFVIFQILYMCSFYCFTICPRAKLFNLTIWRTII